MAELVEAVSKIAVAKGKTRARLIEADVQGSSAYYPAQALKEGAHLFKAGTLMFKNHMTEEERMLRPEGDVNNLLGVLESDAVFEEDGLYADLKIFESNKEWLKERAPYIGLSIRAAGEVVESASGVPTLKSFQQVFSIDAVTQAGAGGKVVSLAESANPAVFNYTKEKEEIMEFPADLAEALDAQAKKMDSVLDAMVAFVEAQKPVVEAPAEVDPLDVAAKLSESGLSKEAAARALAAHKAGTDLEEAIKNEKDYVEQIAESARQNVEFSANIEESGKPEFSASETIFGIKK